MSETRDVLEAEIGARAVGTASIDGRNVPVAFPADETQVVTLLQLAASRGWRVLPIGSGTTLDHGVLREKPRFAISLRGLSGITAFERGDGTITARAGSTMAALSQVARSAGMHVTPDVAGARQATLGGTLGAGASGVDRLRYGPVRHHVLGMRVALADGTITKTGGRLVKNVTGYDLHRLYTGSRGSMCVILEATLRLFPAPERELWLETSFHGRDAALAAAESVLLSDARPSCVVVHDTDDGRWSCSIALVGRAEPVEWERAHVEQLVGACVTAEGREARAAIDEWRDRESRATLRVSCARGELEHVLATIGERCVVAGAGARLVVHPGIATVDVELVNCTGGAASDDVVLDLARALIALDVEVELRNASVAARGAFDPMQHVSANARALMSRLKDALDPQHRFAGERTRDSAAART